MHDFITHRKVVLVGIPVGTARSDRQQQSEFELQACANVGGHTGTVEASALVLQQLVPYKILVFAGGPTRASPGMQVRKAGLLFTYLPKVVSASLCGQVMYNKIIRRSPSKHKAHLGLEKPWRRDQADKKHVRTEAQEDEWTKLIIAASG
jgi:hypothetical protein